MLDDNAPRLTTSITHLRALRVFFLDRHADDSCYTKLSVQFECDFLFLHPEIGMYILEVKATENLEKGLSHSKYLEALKQIQELPLKMRLVWEAITGKSQCDIPIRVSPVFVSPIATCHLLKTTASIISTRI